MRRPAALLKHADHRAAMMMVMAGEMQRSCAKRARTGALVVFVAACTRQKMGARLRNGLKLLRTAVRRERRQRGPAKA
jgi:hypothetical protein